MIYSSLSTSEKLDHYPQCFQTALRYLASRDFTSMECGTYPIQGKDIYAIVQQIETVCAADRRPESHKDYIDIQYLVSGEEKYGFKLDKGGETVVSAEEENDIFFYGDIDGEEYITLQPNDFCIFMPTDIHRPGCAVSKPMSIRKVVVKVSKSLLYKK